MSNIKIFLNLFFVLCFLIATTSAAVWMNNNAKKTVCDGDGKCEDFCEIEGQLLKPGQSFKTKMCSEISCGTDYSTRGVTCGVAVRDGCKMLPDYKFEYPDCCYRICEDDLN